MRRLPSLVPTRTLAAAVAALGMLVGATTVAAALPGTPAAGPGELSASARTGATAAKPGPAVPKPVDLDPSTREIPPEVLATYRAAALRHGVPWPVLAALGRAATDHGARSPDDDVVRTTVWPAPSPAISGPGGVGPMLLDPARVPEVADPAQLQSWPVAVEVVAAHLDAALDAVAAAHGTTRAALAAVGDLTVTSPLWGEAIDALPIAATGGACDARPQEEGGALVRALFTCGLGVADLQVVTPAGVLTGADARQLLTAEAMDLSWRWSRWGAQPCDRRAALAGVFPVPKAVRIDRCDPAADVAWVAAQVAAAERVPLDQRTSDAGGWAGVVGGLLDPSLPAPTGRITPAGLLPDPEPMGQLPTPDTRFGRRVLEEAARYAGGTLPEDAAVVAVAQDAGATRATAWRALSLWRDLRLARPDCAVGLGDLLALVLPSAAVPAGWEASARDGDHDGTVDPADRDDRLATTAVGLCDASRGWAAPLRVPVAATLTGDAAALDGGPALTALATAAALDAALVPALDAATLPDPSIGPAVKPAPRPDLPSAGDDAESAPGGAAAPDPAPPADGPDAGDALATAPVATVPPTTAAPRNTVDAALARVASVVAPVKLQTVGGIKVSTTVAPSLAAMLAAAQADGVALAGGGYRSTASQVLLRAAHCGTTDYDIWQRPSSQCSPATATPGASRHETGEAIDFLRCETRATACYQWLAANAARYGFFNQPSEAWHWSIDGR
jgi:hypothetical protein